MKLKSLIEYSDRCDQMTAGQTEMYLRSFYAEKECEQESGLPQKFADIELPKAYVTLNNRLDIFEKGEIASFHAKLFLSYLSKRPAECIMWAYTLCDMHERTGEKITMETLVEFFPDGFPDEEAMKECWHAQKDDDNEEVPNRIDRPESWEA